MSIVVVGTVVWWLANLNAQPFSMEVHLWSGLNRLISFGVVALASSAMRSQREGIRRRVLDLEHTRELEEEIVRVSEREQMRIGQDLHDGLCQHLAAIDCAVACLRQDLEERQLPEAAAADFIHAQLGRAMTDARDMARGIFPVHIDEEGFIAALEELVANTDRLHQFSVQLHVRGEIRLKDPQTGMHLFRIAQEALNNVRKHAGAGKVEIELSRTDQRLEMTISDDGTGLSEGPARKGIGMQTMRYRARSLGGTLQIDRAPRGGTIVRCTIPLEMAELLPA